MVYTGVYTNQSRNGKNSTWTFTKVEGAENGPVYNIISADNHDGGSGHYLTANSGNTVVGTGNDGTDPYAQWRLLSLTPTFDPSEPIALTPDATGKVWTLAWMPNFDVKL